MATKLTTDEKELLIEAVSAFPALYDKSGDNYRNTSVADEAWRCIAEKFPGYG